MSFITLLNASVFSDYIAPILVFAGVAGVIGFALSFLSEKLKVERDPKIDDVARLLAGVNCGGCGYAGCDAFAEALVKGETTVDKCSPTKMSDKKEIAKILGAELDDSVKLVAIVHCNGGNKCKDKYAYQGYGSCSAAEAIAGGGKACIKGCLGYGDCSDACKYDAISVNKDTGVAEVNSENCTACGVCVSTCPKKIIARIPSTAKIYVACSNHDRGKAVKDICENGCIACGICQKKCPHEAIEVIDNLAVVNYEKCTGCGVCVSACPTKCILPYSYGVNGTAKAKKVDAVEQQGQGA